MVPDPSPDVRFSRMPLLADFDAWELASEAKGANVAQGHPVRKFVFAVQDGDWFEVSGVKWWKSAHCSVAVSPLTFSLSLPRLGLDPPGHRFTHVSGRADMMAFGMLFRLLVELRRECYPDVIGLLHL